MNDQGETAVTDELRWNLLQRKTQRVNSARVVDHFRKRGVESILIKGLAATLVYPEEKYRPASDIDLAVRAEDYAAANKIYNETQDMAATVDLHREFRHLDTVSWDDLYKNSRVIDVEGVPIRLLREEDHFRILCVHWLNDGGAYRDRLWDIYYAVANRYDGFDWDRCFSVVSETRRRWIVCAVAAAHKYLDLDVDGLPFADEARSLPVWMERELEREWDSDVRLQRIDVLLKSPRALFQQLRKRFPPNLIQATIEVEGSIDARSRTLIVIRDILQRIPPSLKRIAQSIWPTDS